MPVAHLVIAPAQTQNRVDSPALSESATAFVGHVRAMQASAKVNSWYHEQRAKGCAAQADEIICRMVFWMGVPLFGRLVLNILVDKLERITDSIERELERV